jgi:hypothetical protein
MPSILDPADTPGTLACCSPGKLKFQLPEAGSRRHRLWELDTAAHCPVLGVCLPLELLRRLVTKALPAHAQDSDYRLHCIAVQECKQRSPLSEALHKALEQRFAGAVRQAAALRSGEALAAQWLPPLAQYSVGAAAQT